MPMIQGVLVSFPNRPGLYVGRGSKPDVHRLSRPSPVTKENKHPKTPKTKQNVHERTCVKGPPKHSSNARCSDIYLTAGTQSVGATRVPAKQGSLSVEETYCKHHTSCTAPLNKLHALRSRHIQYRRPVHKNRNFKKNWDSRFFKN